MSINEEAEEDRFLRLTSMDSVRPKEMPWAKPKESA
jgi:hypothetical protein